MPDFFAIFGKTRGKKTCLLSLNLRVLRNNTDAIFGNFQTLAKITCSEAAGLRLSCNITPQGHRQTQYFTQCCNVQQLWTWSLFCIHSYEALSFYLYTELSTAGFPDRRVCSSLEVELSRSSKDPEVSTQFTRLKATAHLAVQVRLLQRCGFKPRPDHYRPTFATTSN